METCNQCNLEGNQGVCDNKNCSNFLPDSVRKFNAAQRAVKDIMSHYGIDPIDDPVGAGQILVIVINIMEGYYGQ